MVIAGTGTEVGKTWFAVRLVQAARARGLRVAARKPAQSYAQGDHVTDADLLAAASGENAARVCPKQRWYPVPMAPPMAAEVLGQPKIQLDELLDELRALGDVDLAVIETAGGLCSPIAHDADNLALIARLNPTRVILVADAGLGTLNAVRLCLRALGAVPTSVFLNRFDERNDLHVRNREWLSRDGIHARTEAELDELLNDELLNDKLLNEG
jgi:dethiobiotin synthetase